MTQKTQNILTTVCGAILTAVSTITIALAPTGVSTIVATVCGVVNEAINLITEKFVK